MFDRNRNKFMNNGGMPSLGNRDQGYGLSRLNQPQPDRSQGMNTGSYGMGRNRMGYNNSPVPTSQPQPYMQNPAMQTQIGYDRPQLGSRRPMNRDNYINDDFRRRLQQMILRRRNRGQWPGRSY